MLNDFVCTFMKKAYVAVKIVFYFGFKVNLNQGNSTFAV